jgi:hypothetical protein
MEVVALTFDITTRKAITPNEEARARVAKLIVPGLRV